MSKKKPSQLINIQKQEPEWQFDKKAIAQKQAKLKIILDKATKDGTVVQSCHLSRDFDSIKYKEVLYQVGNYIEIWDTSLKEPYVGRLTRIVKVDSSIEHLPFLQIEWCLRKKDLPEQILASIGKHLSLAQIFPSKLKYCIYVPGIKGKCEIFTLEDYSKMALSYENYLFTRASYDDDKKELIPPPNTWKTQCYCGAPQNPDLEYVLCDKCQQWFHVECVDKNQLGDSYVCKNCFEFTCTQQSFFTQ